MSLASLSCLSGVFFSRYEIRDIHLVEESVLESLKVKADFHNFKPRPFNMREFYDRTGHDINDMLLSCHFHGTECRAEDFKVVSFIYLFFLLLPTKQHFCDSFAVKQKKTHVGFASFFFTIRKT